MGYPAHKSCYATAMTIILRLFAWGLAAAIAFATLGPAEQRPHSNLGQNGEHALAFVLLGLAFGLAYHPRGHKARGDCSWTLSSSVSVSR
jgi:hypothetical protein